MLPSNFEPLVAEYPALADAFRKVSGWTRLHETATQINVRELSADLRDLDPWSLCEALLLLVQEGFYDQVYVVQTPSGVIADGVFASPMEIPDKLPDRFNHYFETSDADIITVLAPALKPR